LALGSTFIHEFTGNASNALKFAHSSVMSLSDAERERVPLAAGTHVGAYQVLALLGAGAMGQVYRARDTRLGRDVALKLLPATQTHDVRSRDLAEREARIVASLNHPNILALHDIGVQDGAMYLVTELVDGKSLREATLTLRKSLDIAAQIADGLSAAHAAGVTHRDLKPDNVIVTRDGRVKLLDFGVAKTSRLPSDSDATIPPEDVGVITGTIGYMAPEQVRATEVDSRADIFSFGALLYEMLTGTRAFAGETAADVMTAIMIADPPELPATVPAAVRDIVHRCLEKKREERLQSARDLAFAVRQAASVMGVSPERSAEVIADAVSPRVVRDQLAKLLASVQLRNAAGLSNLLRFIVEETLDGRGSQLKEARIGLEVFGRRVDSYDPAIDPMRKCPMLSANCFSAHQVDHESGTQWAERSYQDAGPAKQPYEAPRISTWYFAIRPSLDRALLARRLDFFVVETENAAENFLGVFA
jgi:serine/threonine protein kinase